MPSGEKQSGEESRNVVRANKIFLCVCVCVCVCVRVGGEKGLETASYS